MKSTSIIISTYNKPYFLEKVLTGYLCQIYKNFDIIIADDGSTEKTRKIIDHFRENTDLDIKHVWHKDNGFQKCTILNKAIEISESDYLIFTDGDCIPNQYFVKTHINIAKDGYFLSGGHFLINESVSELVTKDTIISQKCFNKRFLLANGQVLSKNFLKILKTRFLSYMLDQITITDSTFNGGNSSAWRKDILRVNGFDERMGYGGEDNELGYRLNNIGIKSKQIRNRSSCLHLYHDRPYKNSMAIQKNQLIKHKTISKKSIYTLSGIKKHETYDIKNDFELPVTSGRFMKKINNFRHRRIKPFYYLKNIILLLIPRIFYRLKLKSELNKLNQYDQQYILSRVNYYNKKKNQFTVSPDALTCKQLRTRQTRIQTKITLPRKYLQNPFSTSKYRTYFFDLYRLFSFFQSDKKLDFMMGDLNKTPRVPSIVKSRPIGDNENAILIKLNEIRLFNFINDNKKFIDKKSGAVWRGHDDEGHGENLEKSRQYFLKNYHHVPIFDIGQTIPYIDKPWFKEFMSIYDQLSYKFIFSLEGNDIATNIMWVMSSNSVCVMRKPRYEAWFMEGRLEAGVHYIEVNDDFSNAEEKIKYYNKHTDKALKIIENAHNYIEQFKNLKREKLISLLVLDKYFSLSGQNNE